MHIHEKQIEFKKRTKRNPGYYITKSTQSHSSFLLNSEEFWTDKQAQIHLASRENTADLLLILSAKHLWDKMSLLNLFLDHSNI